MRLLKARDAGKSSEIIEHLVEKRIPPEWVQMAETSDSLIQSTSPNTPKSSFYVPESVSGWVKTMDRDAGDDEKDFARLGDGNFVPDTKLTKYGMSATGAFYAVRTASPDRMIEILQDMKIVPNPHVASEIVSRIEYLSTTLSVKTIRLLLGALSDVPDIADLVKSDSIKSMVRSLGNEILCRFHALSLYSCASILTSLAKLKCVEPGTLNILAIAFEKLSVDPATLAKLSDKRIVEHTLSVMKAYRDLGYSSQVVSETSMRVFEDRKGTISLDELVSFLEILDKRNEEWIVKSLETRIDQSSADELLRLVSISEPESHENIRRIVQSNFVSRCRQQGNRWILVDKEIEDEDGLPTKRFVELTCDQVRRVQQILQL